jgi:7,8-dihydropterin-6-yl-methyl-4-(beta-D-ribofuranosyl)aminobenzene 5'-phosphate synthase
MLEKHNGVSVYVCPGFKEEIKKRIVSSGASLVETAGATLIRDGVHSTGQIRAFSDGREIFEQSLVVKTANGLGVICGCAHPGATDIVENVMGRFGEKVSFLAGGLHLKDEPAGRIDEVISRLKALGVEKVVPLHCTGRTAGISFMKAYGDGYVSLRAGGELEI